MTIVHHAPVYHGFFRPISQHVLVPKSSVGLAARIISQQHGYDIFNNPPFPQLCEQILAFRPSTALPDGNSATVLLSHPDPEYDGAARIFLHPSSTFHFDLDDPSRTLTNPNPPDPSLAAILFPTEVAFIDSIIDSHSEPPAHEEGAHQPYFDWLSQMRDSAFCEYPNEWEYFDTLEDDEPYDDLVWREGKRPWGDGDIPALEYIVRMIKEENRSFVMYLLRGEGLVNSLSKMDSEIKCDPQSL